MSRLHARIPRVFTPQSLDGGQQAELSKAQIHYLVNVMRLGEGAQARLFNGADGEWLCTINKASKKQFEIICTEQLKAPQTLPDLEFLFAPLKHARLDYMAQKAAELGVAVLRPVFTDNCMVSRVNIERMQANVIEAAEQCNLVALPKVCEPQKLDQVLADWPSDRNLIFCDEQAQIHNPVDALSGLDSGPLALLVGPEGGFSDAERTRLLAMPKVTAISLGPRIMRADTAAVAALAVLQAVLGDWR